MTMKVKVYYSAAKYIEIPDKYKELDADHQMYDYDDLIDELFNEIYPELPGAIEVEAITAHADSKVLYEMY